MNDPENEFRKKRKFWQILLVSLVVVVIYGYAMTATQIDLKEPLKPRRQENLVSLLRELARPDFFSYRNETRSTNISIRMPCPEEVKGSQVTMEGRVLVLTPNCATTTQDSLALRGEGFTANIKGAVLWYPAGSDTTRRLTEFRTDRNGRFTSQFTMPDIRETAEPQRIEVVEVLTSRITGLSDSSKITIDRIIETVLMALMASTIGTFLAVPISFLAARNLMADVKSPLAAVMAALILAPIGSWLALVVTGQIVTLSDLMIAQPGAGLAAMLAAGGLAWLLLRLGPPVIAQDQNDDAGDRLLKGGRLAGAALLACFAVAMAAQFGMILGDWLREALGPVAFIGNFIAVTAQFIRVFLPALVAFAGALLLASFGHRWGQEVVLHQSEGTAKWITAVLAAFGSAVVTFLLLYAVNWICLLGICALIPQQNPDLLLALALPALLTGLVVGLLSLRYSPKKQFATGMFTYTVVRGILNGLRSIEPVIMGFVLVVWVGLGPFAGVMALMLHSIADLGKLFSEQVENIAEGPLEAVTATGANRFQTIVFAVIPQIVPHYIAFAFYRWDINVRMSTIIGFVGGGGIGFVLFRNTNLTQYRQAAVMVIAIALVVVVLDYFSSRLRQRIT
ncbi:MAG: ABC transporter permease subunit [Chloroflexota bacterium]